MGQSATTIVAIFLAAILMFAFPMIAFADKKDDAAQSSVQAATTDFVSEIRTTGRLTQSMYDNFVQTIAATGNAYDVDITLQVLDENPAKKSTTTTIGENVYYTEYSTQILEDISNNGGIKSLKEGDIITVRVENLNETIAQEIRNFLYKVVGSESSVIVAEDSGMITVTKN